VLPDSCEPGYRLRCPDRQGGGPGACGGLDPQATMRQQESGARANGPATVTRTGAGYIVTDAAGRVVAESVDGPAGR
jgi:hypothetical protein